MVINACSFVGLQLEIQRGSLISMIKEKRVSQVEIRDNGKFCEG